MVEASTLLKEHVSSIYVYKQLNTTESTLQHANN